MNSIIENVWNRLLRRPYCLAKVVESGSGSPIILLHGIGRTGNVWKYVVTGLSRYSYRIIAFDLLGFGASAKPQWLDYTVDDHAKAVIASIIKLDQSEPVVLVGHSMGCLIAVRVARLRPDLVRHLVLYEMPLYEGLPLKRLYRLRLGIYARFYSWVINYQPQFDERTAKRAEKLARRIIGFEVNKESWTPFIKSLSNTIMHQTAAEDIRQILTPMDVIYGTFDMFVIRGKTENIFGSTKENITTHNVRAKHVISPKASKLIVQRIVASFSY